MATLTAKTTAGSVAGYIRQPGEPLSAATDRLRNWTKVGIIQSEGEKHPGTGRAKQYSSAAILEAVLLQAFSNALGSPAVLLSPHVKQISKMVQQGILSDASVVVISGPPDVPDLRLGDVKLKNLGRYMSKHPGEVHIVLNLFQIFKRLPYDPIDAFPGLKDAVAKRKRMTRKART